MESHNESDSIVSDFIQAYSMDMSKPEQIIVDGGGQHIEGLRFPTFGFSVGLGLVCVAVVVFLFFWGRK